VQFSVESDLPHVSGDSQIAVEVNQKKDYILNIHPLLGGTYTGTLTFLAPNGQYTWYTVEIQASPPEAEGTLDISSCVRKAMSVEISLSNPLDKPVEFEVFLQGAGLLGDPVFHLNARESATYDLLFSPLLPGATQGSISFTNDKVGELWYKLNLTAEAAPTVEIERMKCAVGGSCTKIVTLENPCNEELVLNARSDNPRNFAVTPAQLVLAPYETLEWKLEYTPSSLDQEETATISFGHQRLGEWVYKVTGKGHEPSTMDPVVIITPVRTTTSQSFTFRNPFPDNLDISVSMSVKEGDNEALDAFRLLLNKNRTTLGPFGKLQVPISYWPKSICEQQCQVEIVTSRSNLTWVYPVRGIAEASMQDQTCEFKCKSRSVLDTQFVAELRGLAELEGGPEYFSYDLVVPEDCASVVDRSLVMKQLDKEINPGSDPKIRFNVRFSPLRPMQTTLELIVNKRSGGRWKYEITFIAEEPNVDDVISIEATLNHTSSVTFRLANQFLAHAPFTAEFSSDSPYSFAVFPAQGVLDPYGQDGTQFFVSFSPTEYGKPQIGHLFITTEEMQWHYEVRGKHPDYKVPDQKSKLDLKLDSAVASKLGQRSTKNILKKNINQSKTRH
jgi:hypothetical protein